MWKPGIVVFRKLQSNAFVKLQTIKKIHYYKRRECLESYESIALKLAKDDYAWFDIKMQLNTLLIVIFLNNFEFYESIALKLAKDEYAWFPHV